jgi:peptidyl-prolyl cis-trans isomerase A (cyclophilin A)
MLPRRRPAFRFARRNVFSPIESLEARQFLSATNVGDAPDVSGQSGTTNTGDLSAFIDDPAVDSQVRFHTELGDIDLQLHDQQKPITVANFLKYVRQGRYDTTIIHRATEPSTGLEVIQGGGYGPPTFQHIDTSISGTGIQNEANTAPILSNVRGTIAMARTSDPNSATSEWFINSTDNTSLDPANQPPGYAVFGDVINGTMTTVDAIQALPVYAFQNPFTEIPLRNYTQQDFQNQKTPTSDNFVSVTAITLPKLTYAVQSSNPDVVDAAINGDVLTLTFKSTGTADITFSGTDGQNQTVSQTFTATSTEATTQAVTLKKGGATSVSFTDADGTKSTVSYKGGGTATVNFTGTNVTQNTVKTKTTVGGTGVALSDISITGGTAADAVSITGKGGDGKVSIGGFITDAGLKSLSAKAAAATGVFTTGGTVGKVDIGTADTLQLNLGGDALGAKTGVVNLGTVTGSEINSTAPLKSITAGTFAAGTNGTQTITTPSVDTLTVKGDMAQNLNVSGAVKKIAVSGNMTASVAADTIGSLAVKGALSSSNITVSHAFAAGQQPLGKVTVGGAITGTKIIVAGNITSVTAGALSQSTIYAGVAQTVTPTTLPAQGSDFASPALIGSVKVKTSTDATNIAASNLGKLALGTVTTGNAGTPFGLAADNITALAFAVTSAKVALKNLHTPADVSAQTVNLNLEDFKIQVI